MIQDEKQTIDSHIAALFDSPTSGDPEEVPTDGSPVEGEEVEGETLEDALADGDEGEEEAEETEEQASTVASLHQRIAAARLREIHNLRTQNRALKAQQDAVNQRVSQIESRFQQAEQPVIDQELLDADPALRYFHDRFEKLEGKVNQALTPPPGIEGHIAPEVFDESVRYAQESRQAFKQHTRDWDDAYLWLRDKVAADNGFAAKNEARNEFLNVTEASAVLHWMGNGQDPAAEIYERAVEAGWRPGMRTNGAPPRSLSNTSKVRRVKEVLGSPSLSGMRGDKAEGGSYISTKEFHRRYSHDQRIRLYQGSNGDEIHEQVASGRIDTSLLP